MEFYITNTPLQSKIVNSFFLIYIYSWTISTPPWLATSTWPRLSGTVCSLLLQARRAILMLMNHLCALIAQPSCTQTEGNCNLNCSPQFLLVHKLKPFNCLLPCTLFQFEVFLTKTCDFIVRGSSV